MNNLISNVNDNYLTHQLYRGRTNHFPYVNAARYLIRKYIPHYWKNDCNDIDFIDMELTLCGYLEMPADCITSRKLKIKWIAGVLNINFLALYNDPDLPF